MRFAVVLASLAALMVAAPGAAQPRAAVVPGSAAVTPLPAALAPATRGAESRPLLHAAPRSAWRYPRIGLLAGAVAGAAFGTYIMATADEWMAPPAHIVTVPGGALVGLAAGGLANLIDPP
jgi:ferric-dicitrate binding protein FerR (iron transport regulator)